MLCFEFISVYIYETNSVNNNSQHNGILSIEKKLFEENIEKENKKSQLKAQTLKNFQEYEKEKHAKK